MAKNHQKKHSKELAKLKILLLKNSNSDSNLSHIRTTIPLSKIEEIVLWIGKEKSLATKLFKTEFPRTYFELEPYYLPFPHTSEFEIRWTGSCLFSYTKELIEFNKLRNLFEFNILNDDYNESGKILSLIEEKFGLSLWLLSNRIALLQNSEGLETQKKLANQVQNSSKKNGIVSFISYYLSIRNEVSVTPNRFFQLLLNNFLLYEVPKDYQHFMLNFLFPQNELSNDEISAVLNLSHSCSVIDGYETLIRVAQSIITSKQSSLYSSLSFIFKKLYRGTYDSRLIPILFELGETDILESQINDKSIEASDALLTNNFTLAISIAEEELKLKNSLFDLWFIVAKSKALQGNLADESKINFVDFAELKNDKKLYQNIIEFMALILTNDAYLVEIKNALYKVALNYNSHSWSPTLIAFLKNELTNEPLPDLDQGVRLGSLSYENFHPLRLASLDSTTKRNKYLKLVEKFYSKVSVSIDYGNSLVTSNVSSSLLEQLSQNEKLLLIAENAFRDEIYTETIENSDELCKSKFGFYKHRGIRLKSHSLLRIGNIDEAIEFVVHHLISEPHLYSMVPIKMLVENIDKDCRLRMKANISLPIIYNLYSDFIDDSFDYVRNYTYEDFLAAHSFDFPSKLKSIENEINKDALTYFLSYISIESIMDNSTVFESSQDIAKERLNICKYLIELDSQNTEIYQEEIKDINRRLMLQQRIQEVERSKIYVDIENIKKKVGGSGSILREGFNRYISFLKSDYNPDKFEFNSERIRTVKYKSSSGEELEAFVILPIPDNEMTQLFESLFIQLRDEFVSSNEHGLDTYLSVRIRHGTLGGQLRSPLESLHLITQRESSNRYKDNEYWISKIKEQTFLTSQFADYYESEMTAFITDLNIALAQFSEKFDNLTQEILKTWIQVRKKSEDQGLFNFIFDKREINIFSSLITSETTFEEFVDVLVNIFERRLTGCLVNIRERFVNECKTQIIELLTSLQSSIEHLGKQYSIYTSDITNALNTARTNILTVIDRITEWFTLSKSIAREPFQLEDAARISEASVQTFVQNFASEINVCDEMPHLEGGLLNGIVDIFFIVFENIVKHAGVMRNPVAHVNLKYEGNLCTILVENEIETNFDVETVSTKLQSIKEGLVKGKYISASTIEGGTGFYKIMKILKHDFGLNPEIDFGFRENQRFYVSIGMKLKIIEI